jgi:hypothetical protein
MATAGWPGLAHFQQISPFVRQAPAGATGYCKLRRGLGSMVCLFPALWRSRSRSSAVSYATKRFRDRMREVDTGIPSELAGDMYRIDLLFATDRGGRARVYKGRFENWTGIGGGNPDLEKVGEFTTLRDAKKDAPYHSAT